MPEKTKTPVTEACDQMVSNCEQFFKAGITMQEQAARLWTDCLARMPVVAMPEAQKRFNAMIVDSIPAAQKRLEESLKVVEQTGRLNLELMKQALQAAPPQPALAAQEKIKEALGATWGTFRSNVAALTQTNTKLLELWLDAVPKEFPSFAPKAKAV